MRKSVIKSLIGIVVIACVFSSLFITYWIQPLAVEAYKEYHKPDTIIEKHNGRTDTLIRFKK